MEISFTRANCSNTPTFYQDYPDIYPKNGSNIVPMKKTDTGLENKKEYEKEIQEKVDSKKDK